MPVRSTFKTLAVADGEAHGIESQFNVLRIGALNRGVSEDGETLGLLVQGELQEGGREDLGRNIVS